MLSITITSHKISRLYFLMYCSKCKTHIKLEALNKQRDGRRP